MTDIVEHSQLVIGGQLVDPLGTDTIEVVSPHTEEVFARVPHASTADVDAAVAAARKAFEEGPWPRMSLDERITILEKIRDGFMTRSQELAEVVASQNGSPVGWGLFAQAIGAGMIYDTVAKIAREYRWEEKRTGLLNPLLVRREPVGVVAAVVPWNVPQFVTAAKLAPAIASGCTVVLKPSPETPLDSYILAEICRDAGLPDGVLSIVAADREVSEYLVGHPGIDKVAFTGSVGAGKRIMEVAARNLTRVTLELGGKSAAIILPDADLEHTATTLLPNSYMNNGQACVAQTRILAPRARYDEIAERFAAWVGELKVGDPMAADTQVGPLVAKRQQQRSFDYIRIGQEEGAKILAGGGRPEAQEKGWYVEPTLFGDVDNSMRIAQEEIFGPVVALIAYDDEEQAIALANDSDFGLSGSVWTTDIEKGIDVARRIRTGTYSVNTFGLDFFGPFGGYKNSGIGREFGIEGLDAYTEAKSIALPAGYDAQI
ncbi:aldehyde dehydrogenase [Embleya sp. NPDC056575]|uniref:aldehyde dehydrogenase n=1 Tax=unclassified Embleya TaxID=2699296 RepID=UPI003680970B